MATIDLMRRDGAKVVLQQGSPASNKAIIFRSAPRTMNPSARSPAMLKAEIGLGEKAISLRGDFGTVQLSDGRVIPKISFDVGKDLRGKSYGGLSYRERLERNHARADASIAKLKSILNSKGMGGSASRFMSE
jgi:hypothetical protein